MSQQQKKKKKKNVSHKDAYTHPPYQGLVAN